MKDFMKRMGSRKFVGTWMGVGLCAYLPFLYAQASVDTSVQLLSLGLIGALLGVYNFSNVIDKKNGGE